MECFHDQFGQWESHGLFLHRFLAMEVNNSASTIKFVFKGKNVVKVCYSTFSTITMTFFIPANKVDEN